MDHQLTRETTLDEPRQERSSYRSGFAYGILSFLAVAIVSLLSAIATARVYGVHVIGQFALVSAPVAVLWVLSTAKEQAALVREISQLPRRDHRATQLFAAVFSFSAALTLFVAGLAAIVSFVVFRGPLHRPDLLAPTLVSLAGYATITNTGWNIDSVFSAFLAGRQLFLVRFHETLATLTVAIAIGIAWPSVWGLVIATIAGSLTPSCSAWCWCAPSFDFG